MVEQPLNSICAGFLLVTVLGTVVRWQAWPCGGSYFHSVRRTTLLRRQPAGTVDSGWNLAPEAVQALLQARLPPCPECTQSIVAHPAWERCAGNATSAGAVPYACLHESRA